MLMARELTEQVIGLAIDVHRLTGPGMLESVYEGCLCHELAQAGIPFERQVGFRSLTTAYDSTKASAPTFWWIAKWSLKSRRWPICCRYTTPRC